MTSVFVHESQVKKKIETKTEIKVLKTKADIKLRRKTIREN